MARIRRRYFITFRWSRRDDSRCLVSQDLLGGVAVRRLAMAHKTPVTATCVGWDMGAGTDSGEGG